MSSQPGEAPPIKKARPTSVEDVLVERQERRKNRRQPGPGQQGKGRKGKHSLGLKEIKRDPVTKKAKANWSTEVLQSAEPPAFNPELVKTIYNDNLGGKSPRRGPPLRRVMMLEISQYLENYLWPNFDASTASYEHVMSIILMVNEKFREGMSPWSCFHKRQEVFPDFFKAFLGLKDQLAAGSSEGAAAEGEGEAEGAQGCKRSMHMHERTAYLVFTINVFQSLEDEMVRGQVLRLVSLPLWQALSPGRLQLELHALPQLAKHWKHLLKKEAKAAKVPGYLPPQQRPEAGFLPALLDEFADALGRCVVERKSHEQQEAEAEAEAAAAAEEEEEDSEEDESEDDEEEEGEGEGAEKAAGATQEKQPAPKQPAAAKPATQAQQQAAAQQAAAQQRARQQAAGVPREPPSVVLARGPLTFCERCVELLTDLLSQLPTRRFVRTLLEDRAVLVKAKMAPLYSHPDAQLYRQLVDLLTFYMAFPISDHTGEPLTDDEVIAAHYEKVCTFQRLAFKHWPQLRDLALSNCGQVEKRETLKRALAALPPDELRELVVGQLRLVSESDPWAANNAFLMEVMLAAYERRRSQREVINEMPLYPTEGLLWDESQIPSVNYTGEACLALPKLNLQFLTPHDYLLRNFNLFRLEATYEIREDIADVLGRVGAYWDDVAETPVVKFAGWARMGLPLQAFRITEVRKPGVGEAKPAGVSADVVIDTRGLRGDIRGEWDEVKQHDVLFLLTIRPPSGADVAAMHEGGRRPSAAEKYGLAYVRGCEVVEVKDEGGRLMNDFTGRVRRDEAKPPEGTKRTLTVALDTAQYQLDMNHLAKHKTAEDPYGTFNLLMRRKPKENNFKAVLECIRDLMNEEVIIPPWLHDIFLGYGDPGAAQWRSLPPSQRLRTVDFGDTFLDAQHVRDSFPNHTVEFKPAPGQAQPLPPFRITLPAEPEASGSGAGTKRGAEGDADGEDAGAAQGNGSASGAQGGGGTIVCESYVPPDPGPYPQDRPRGNDVRFTPVQLDAIMSGVQPGLTMVVGPPGTGKTDTAVQIMTTLYTNCPGQRTLLITHSNQALNDLFQKIMGRNIPDRYLLRLGMGEQDLEGEGDFSRVGRVNAMLARRLTLLAQVERMARIFGVAEDVAYTCETAGHFWLLHVLSRWEKFCAAAERAKTAAAVAQLFPFTEYFADAPEPVFRGDSYERDMERARGCFRHLRTLFQELEECRAFELLKGQGDRVNYLMARQAKVVAMTCTHAALKRREFIDLAFKYDNLVMEEAGQILEIETFIPLLLQRQEDGVSRLKRVVLIGDHHQLPPVVQNMAIQKYAHLDQPLFTRFIRLGTPYVELNAQGRARPSIAKLYNWRYRSLGDLPAVQQLPAFSTANAGLAYDYQFIHVPDFMGQGEMEPSPYFYQNLGEAEYAVHLYCFMRLMGYPAHKISILTTYNGQKHLLRDVIDRRCARHPLFGRPHKVTTVDKYQGQQNDFVILSLVRSRVVGHLRDVRRLVVAMSRARLGLYVFGRRELFGDCYELQPTFKQLLARPTKLALVKGEGYGSVTRQLSDKVQPDLIPGVEAMGDLVSRITAEQMAAQYAQYSAAVQQAPADGAAGEAGGEAAMTDAAAVPAGGEEGQQGADAAAAAAPAAAAAAEGVQAMAVDG